MFYLEGLLDVEISVGFENVEIMDQKECSHHIFANMGLAGCSSTKSREAGARLVLAYHSSNMVTLA